MKCFIQILRRRNLLGLFCLCPRLSYECFSKQPVSNFSYCRDLHSDPKKCQCNDQKPVATCSTQHVSYETHGRRNSLLVCCCTFTLFRVGISISLPLFLHNNVAQSFPPIMSQRTETNTFCNSLWKSKSGIYNTL